MIILKVLVPQIVIKNRKNLLKIVEKSMLSYRNTIFSHSKDWLVSLSSSKLVAKWLFLMLQLEEKYSKFLFWRNGDLKLWKSLKNSDFGLSSLLDFFSRTLTELRIGLGMDPSLVNKIQKQLVDGIDSINFYPYDMPPSHIWDESSLTYHTAKIPEELN